MDEFLDIRFYITILYYIVVLLINASLNAKLTKESTTDL